MDDQNLAKLDIIELSLKHREIEKRKNKLTTEISRCEKEIRRLEILENKIRGRYELESASFCDNIQ